MIDDGESSTLLSESIREARKDHRCSECRRKIEKGEIYLSEAVVFDGQLGSYKTCTHCLVARRWLAAECGGWIYGGVLEDIQEHVSQAFPDYYGKDLAVVAKKMRRGWKWPNGQLFKIPNIPKTSADMHDEFGRMGRGSR